MHPSDRLFWIMAAATAAYVALRPKVRAPASSVPDGPRGWSAGVQGSDSAVPPDLSSGCLNSRLHWDRWNAGQADTPTVSASLAGELRDGVDAELLSVPNDRAQSARALEAAARTLRRFCPAHPVPQQTIQVASHRENNGPGWSAVFDYAWTHARARVMPVPV